MEELVGNSGEEVANSHARFENAPAGEPKAVGRLPHLVYDLNGRVVGIERRFLDRIDLFLGEDLGKAVALLVVAIALIPQFAQSAEVDVLRNPILLVGSRGALFALDGLEQLKDVEVVLYAGLWPALRNMGADIVVKTKISVVTEGIGWENRLGWRGLGGVV